MNPSQKYKHDQTRETGTLVLVPNNVDPAALLRPRAEV